MSGAALALQKPAAAARVRLMDGVQFLYELRLAALELEALAGGAEMESDLRTFHLPPEADIAPVLRRAAYADSADDIESDYAKLVRHNRTRSFNQYITHWFYPYKGKFHPQMARALANIIGMRPGETLLDPFVGSGTAAVEGALLELKTIGFDISPLCVLIGKVKANAVHHLPKLERAVRAALFADSADDKSGAEELERALRDPVAGFDLLARLIALSDHVRRRRDFAEQLRENRGKMLESVRLMKAGCDLAGVSPVPADIRLADARRLPLEDESVDGVLTSPPYSIALNYVANDAHALRFLGAEPERAAADFIGVRGAGGGRIALYESDMREVYAEIARVLRPGRTAAIVLGDATVNGVRVPTVKNCEDAFREMGFRQLERINKIIFGLYNVMQREDILLFQKPGRAQ